MGSEINGPMFYLGTRRIFAEVVVAVPTLRRSNRPGNEPAAAVGADIMQHVLHTRRTERTLIGADARLKRIRRQRLIAVLASRSEFKHGVLAVKLSKTGNQLFLEPLSALKG